MTITLILALSVLVGMTIRRWWALVLPMLIGAVSAAVITLTGHGLQDTPIPFLMITATFAVGIGVLLRTRRFTHSV